MIHLILAIVFITVLVRLVTLPFRIGRRRRFFGGYNNGYGNSYGYGHRRGGGIFTLLALVALDRLFSGRRF